MSKHTNAPSDGDAAGARRAANLEASETLYASILCERESLAHRLPADVWTSQEAISFVERYLRADLLRALHQQQANHHPGDSHPENPDDEGTLQELVTILNTEHKMEGWHGEQDPWTECLQPGTTQTLYAAYSLAGIFISNDGDLLRLLRDYAYENEAALYSPAARATRLSTDAGIGLAKAALGPYVEYLNADLPADPVTLLGEDAARPWGDLHSLCEGAVDERNNLTAREVLALILADMTWPQCDLNDLAYDEC